MNTHTWAGLAIVAVAGIIWRLWAWPEFRRQRAFWWEHGRLIPAVPPPIRGVVLLVAGVCAAVLFALLGFAISWLDRALAVRPM